MIFYHYLGLCINYNDVFVLSYSESYDDSCGNASRRGPMQYGTVFSIRVGGTADTQQPSPCTYRYSFT